MSKLSTQVDDATYAKIKQAVGSIDSIEAFQKEFNSLKDKFNGSDG